MTEEVDKVEAADNGEKKKNTDNKFEQEYSEKGFWDKIKNYARVAGESVLEPALRLFYAAQDDDTPAWAKSVVYAALGYFITPLDAIPDLTPLAGYSDDLGVLVAAVAAIAAHIKVEHKEKARETMGRWFDRD
jgi:uncharacterized membrane protein YkvA (DUF1232 family)